MSDEQQREVARIRAEYEGRLQLIEQLAASVLATRGEVCAPDVADLLIEQGHEPRYVRAMVRRHLRRLCNEGKLHKGELRHGPISGFPRRYYGSVVPEVGRDDDEQSHARSE